MGFITRFLKSTTLDAVVRRFLVHCLCCLGLVIGQMSTSAPVLAAELSQWKVERTDEGVYLSAVVQFELTAVVEDALLKGIPMFFVAQADIYQNRWYWVDRRVASATRTIRLAYQPLTRRWRVNIFSGLINNTAGLRATLNQNYDTLPEALYAVQRLSLWKVADNTDIEPDIMHQLEFGFSLDLSQLPRPFQIGVAGQKDWNISVRQNERLQMGVVRPVSSLNDKSKLAALATKEADR